MTDDTEPVRATVIELERLAQPGRLLALASVEIEIAGVAFVLHGVRVVRTGAAGVRGVAPPVCRDRRGILSPAAELPPELARALAAAVLDVFDDGAGAARSAGLAGMRAADDAIWRGAARSAGR